MLWLFVTISSANPPFPAFVLDCDFSDVLSLNRLHVFREPEETVQLVPGHFSSSALGGVDERAIVGILKDVLESTGRHT